MKKKWQVVRKLQVVRKSPFQPDTTASQHNETVDGLAMVAKRRTLLRMVLVIESYQKRLAAQVKMEVQIVTILVRYATPNIIKMTSRDQFSWYGD